jgi:5-methylcytosine-specific restriction endonuclease McrA
MPIRPENRARYPEDWPTISLSIRQRAGNRCEACGVPNGEYGGRLEDGTWCPAIPIAQIDDATIWPTPGVASYCQGPQGRELLRIVRIVLTVAHLDHQPENCADTNLRAWCQRCHNRYDAKTRAAGIKARARAAAAAGDLFDDGKT